MELWVTELSLRAPAKRCQMPSESAAVARRSDEPDSMFYYLPNPFFRLDLNPNNAQQVSFWDLVRSLKPQSNSEEELSAALNKTIGSAESVFTNSGRSALLLALRILGVKRGDEVVLPTFVCHTVADSVIASGATPVLADVKGDGTLDPAKLQPCISDRTRAIIAVHYLGLPCDISKVTDMASPKGITVIGDCAQALSSEYDQRNVASHTALSFLSFGPDKPLCFGSGGMLVVNSSEFKNVMSQPAFPKARDRSFAAFYELVGRLLIHRKPVYGVGTIVKMPVIGISYIRKRMNRAIEVERMSRLAVSYGLRCIGNLSDSNRKRAENSKAIEEIIDGNAGVSKIPHDSNKNPVFLKYTALAKNRAERYRLMKSLKHNGIEAGPSNWRTPLHKTDYYADICRHETSLNGAEEFADRFVNLPCHPRMDEGDFARLATALQQFRGNR